MTATLIILAVAAILFVSGKVRSDIVALCSLIALLLCQILTVDEAMAGFSNSVVIMMVGLFIVGGGIFQTGLAKKVSSQILRFAGNSELKLEILVMLVTCTIGAFVSNTGTVALLLPIVVSLATNAGMNPSRLLMPMAFASSMGGMMTLIGTPPNLIISDTLTGAGYGSLEFFSFLPVGLICLATGMLFLIPASKLVLGKKKRQGNDSEDKETLSALVNEYGITDNLFRIKASASIDGKTIAELDIRNKYSLNVVEIRRERKGQHRFFKTVQQELATAGTRINPNDILYLSGNFEDVGRFAKDYGCDILDKHSIEENQGNRDKLDFYDVGVAEILILPSSDLTNDSVKTIGFREKFNLNILGIKRKKGYILKDLGNVKLQENDVLLVQGKWQDIARLDNENNEWVVLGQPLEQASKVTLDYKAPVAAAILIMMVVLMVLDLPAIKPVTAVLVASILMVVTGCVRNMEAAYKTINWETIVLFAAMLPMSTALEKTGVSDFISGSLAGGLGDFGPVALLAGIYFTTSLMTIFISNTVTAVLMAPIALHSAEAMGLSPVPFLFAVTVAASMCFASPFSTPPNAMVMHPGQYSFMDFIKVGLPLQVIMGIVMVLVLPLIFPF